MNASGRRYGDGMDRRSISRVACVATLLVAAWGIASCGGDDGTAPGGDGGFGGETGYGIEDGVFPWDDSGPIGTPIDSLSIDPPAATLFAKAGGPPLTQQFRAFGKVGGGAPFQVPALFTADNVAPGNLSAAGLFTTNNLAGGTVNVKATYAGKSATALLIVQLEADHTSGNVPQNPGTFFDPKTNTIVTNDATHSPSLVYPVPETRFPQNLYRTMFNWRPGAGNNLFLLKFESQPLTLNVYTDGVHTTCTQAGTGGSCWETVQQTWTLLALSNAGGSTKLTVYGTDVNNKGKVYATNGANFSFSKSPVPGALYYWSTTVQGVRRGALSDVVPTNFLTPPEADGNCVACHTLSRNGKRLAADVQDSLWVVDVVKVIPPPRVFTSFAGQPIPNAWATFNPATTRIVSAKKGVMRLLDGNTGGPIGGNNGVIAGPSPCGTMPDWAPDGKHLVFVQSAVADDRKLTGSSIAWLSVMNDTFSSPQIVLQSAGSTDNYAFPMFNWTSEWLALEHCNGNLEKDPSCQILVAKAQAASTAQQLVRADTLVNDTTVASGVHNSQPTWAPTAVDGTQWVAFTSTRNYGTILTPGSTYGSNRNQLWIAALDASKLGQGDPSFPAFRIPFVDLTENSHRPFWAEDTFVPPPGDGGVEGGVPCAQAGQDCSNNVCCNGLQCIPVGNTYQCKVPLPPN